jgi:hypothetical protein
MVDAKVIRQGQSAAFVMLSVKKQKKTTAG